MISTSIPTVIRRIGVPGPHHLTWFLLTLGIPLLVAVSFETSQGQPISPQDGGSLPQAALQQMQADPSAYTFRNAYLQQVDRLKANRRLIQSGQLRPGSELERLNLTAVTGTRFVPIFLGKYSDTGASPIAQASLQQELFDGPWPTGTMAEYYTEISYGNLTLVGTVFDWVTVTNTDNFYAGTVYGLTPGSSQTGAFITEILTANDAGLDFGQFDNDGPDGLPNSGDDDGFVDFIGIIQPEKGGECLISVDDIWSHRWVLSAWPEGIFTTNDARSGGGMIRINDYTIMPALSCAGGMIEIGVFCHEFGHAFGLPDFYDTNSGNGTSEGIGHWGLMGSGNWQKPTRPAHMGPWTKAELGWLTPTTVTADLTNWPISSSTLTPTAFKLWANGTPGSEYFLIENRTATGFDDQIHKAGLVVWHIDEAAAGNTDETHKKIDVECADQTGADHTTNADDLDAFTNRGDPGDPFCDGDTFGPATNPSSVAYNSVATSVTVTNISGCGDETVLADLLVGQETGLNVNLCMRDCGADVCAEPSPCANFWSSPEVFIDNNEDGIIDAPAEGIPNKLFTRVRNVGANDASNVNVSFYIADPAMGLLFPSTATLIDSVNVPLIGAGGSEVAGVLWTIPVPPPTISHFCVGVIATNPQDGQSSEQAKQDNNVAQINIQALIAKAGDAVPPKPGSFGTQGVPTIFETTQIVRACNSGPEQCTFDVVIGSPPNFDDAVIPANWEVDVDPQSGIIPAKTCIDIKVIVRNINAIHGDFARVPLTLLCDQVVVGGDVLEFQIDNVAPRPPCTFSAFQKLIPETENNPGDKAVRISWPDDTFDILGFAEEVERWRIYQGNSAGFVPSSANLLIETCIDEDPTTTDYDHFANAPVDPDNTWYKLVAVDRAGNESDTCVTKIQFDLTGVDDGALRDGLRLAQNMPNPFGSVTTILYVLPQAGEVALTVYSANGRLVRRLVGGAERAGMHQVVWDGTDDDGRQVATGAYIYKLVYEGFQMSRRMILIQ